MAETGDQIDLEIVTPRGRVLHAAVDEVTAPSVNGQFGVLPGHLPLLAALRIGLMTYRQGGETTQCALGPGFAEAGANNLLVLTDNYVDRKDVDPVIVRKELAEVKAEIAKTESALGNGPEPATEAQLRTLILQENWLAAQLELYGDPPPATMRPFEEWGPPAPPAESDVPLEEAVEDAAKSG